MFHYILKIEKQNRKCDEAGRKFNPRPDGVWRVTRPDGGWPKGPPSVSSKVRVVE